MKSDILSTKTTKSTLLSFIPMDRRQALVQGTPLPDRANGAILFADISGFSSFTKVLEIELGHKRGAEELLRYINRIYETLIAELYRFGGSVIGFAGDSIICWLDETKGSAIPRTVAAGLAMQAAIRPFSIIRTPSGSTVNIDIKIAIAAGSARRFIVGDPTISTLDVLAGETLIRMANAEKQAQPGEIVASEEVVTKLDCGLQVVRWIQGSSEKHRFAVISQLHGSVSETPWPPLDTTHLTVEMLQKWVILPVLQRLQAGEKFLGDLRPVTPLFLKFSGIDYDHDKEAGQKLDIYVRWVQSIVAHYEGHLLQLTTGDKGTYLYINFGSLLTYENNTVHAVLAALALQKTPREMTYIESVQIGISQGIAWTGACGSAYRHDYVAMGNPVNIAARLMVRAKPGQILVNHTVAVLAQKQILFRNLDNIHLKGYDDMLFRIAEAVTQKPTPTLLSEQFLQPMVGRQTELKQLLMLLEEVTEGAGRVVIIEAEAGLGKSRLAAAWAMHVRKQGLYGFWGGAQNIEQHTPYRAWQDLLASFLKLTTTTAVNDQQDKIYSRIQALAPEVMEYTPLLGDILGIPLLNNNLTASLSAQGRQQALITLLLALFKATTHQSPLLLMLENGQWLDAASWELTLQIVRGLAVTETPLYVPDRDTSS